ncbi:Gfo/Idh/MocA family oxidoreductase [Nesterenkonia sp. NBAIMH1]|uniref:Gfo/Idh/MocA family oxidoreductase n=1 Tax=Nesterenkonia sp. NBAIMH1 TaxID=2600320 RepID=UPI0011B65EFD|nr:Gfo/Idh/MocA family oxidoreductase [Nesterenkonia sp. NBAIMH1]
MSEDTSELTLGVLGAGRIGRIHAAHMAMHPQVGAVVLLGRDQGRLESALPEILRIAEEAPRPSDQEQVAAKLRPRVLPESAGRVGAYEGLDGLVVAASTEAHGPLITEAVASGIPLLIEKPLAASVEEQLELIRLMESRGIRAMMGYNRRFDDAHRQLRSRVLSGVLGTPGVPWR